jgi:uncharacterized protein YbaR (Trm112 family)
MFIELAEHLRCPLAHDGRHSCVLMPERLEHRDVVAGAVACPVCRREYPIAGGIADLRHPDDDLPVPDLTEQPVLPPALDVAALLALRGAGGYIVLVGSAGHLAEGLADTLDGVHVIVVNPPAGLGAAPTHSVLRGGRALPLQTSMARGVVVGEEHAREPWLAEGARLLLRGLRLVALREGIACDGLERLASGSGMTLGQRI